MKKSLSRLVITGLLLLTSYAHSNTPVHIEWQPDTLTLIQADAYYGRIIRLRSDTLLACYTCRGRAYVKHSKDNGQTWVDETLAAVFSEVGADNTELLQLSDKRIMLMINERNRQNPRQNGISVAFSSDDGHTWTNPTRIYTGKCWEPAAIERSRPKAIELYFADEEPYQDDNRNDQNISVMFSTDGGQKWAGPAIVSYRQNHRDGMPVPLTLRNGNIVIAIEDPGLHGDFKPVILDFSRRRNAPIHGASPYRWSAMAEALPRDTYAGAPYIAQMPSGETILSYRYKPKNVSHHTMIVAVGNEQARSFQQPTMPFSMADKGVSQDWSALFVKNDTTITAVSGARISGVRGLWAIDGQLTKGP